MFFYCYEVSIFKYDLIITKYLRELSIYWVQRISKVYRVFLNFVNFCYFFLTVQVILDIVAIWQEQFFLRYMSLFDVNLDCDMGQKYTHIFFIRYALAFVDFSLVWKWSKVLALKEINISSIHIFFRFDLEISLGFKLAYSKIS